MRLFERFVRIASEKIEKMDLSMLKVLGSRALSIYFARAGGIYRRLCGNIEVKLSHRFRYIQETYEIESLQLMRRLLRSGDTGVDVGANIGLYTLIMGKLVGVGGRVCAFEPGREAFEVLCENVALNSLCNVVETYQLLVGEEAGVEIFSEDGCKGTNRVGGSKYDGPKTKKVKRKTIRLDDFFFGCNKLPEFIKIDVEGYEVHVLRGALNILKKSRPTIICEVHPPLLVELGLGLGDIQELMATMRYGIFNLNGKIFKDFEFDKNCMILCVPME